MGGGFQKGRKRHSRSTRPMKHAPGQQGPPHGKRWPHFKLCHLRLSPPQLAASPAAGDAPIRPHLMSRQPARSKTCCCVTPTSSIVERGWRTGPHA